MAHLKIAFVFIALAAVTLPIEAIQDHEPPPLNGFAIEILFPTGQPIHFFMSGRELKGQGSFTVPPREIIKLAARDSEQVSMVMVSASSEEGTWRIRVSVVKGEFYDKGEQDVATYLVRENEKALVKKMRQFGIKPFEVSVVRLNQTVAFQPRIMNKTESIAVTSLEATTIPSSYRIFLRNLSHKNVLALEINTYCGDQMRWLRWPHGSWDHPLMEPGGTYREEISSEGHSQTTLLGYVPEQSTSIEISTVVFTDGTYEGNPYLAAVTKAEAMGSATQLKRILPLLQTAWESKDDTNENVLSRLMEAVSLLGEEVSPSQLKELGQFPTLKQGTKLDLTSFVRSQLHHVKSSLLKEIEVLQKQGQSTSGSSLREWIARTKDKYERWLSTLGVQQALKFDIQSDD